MERERKRELARERERGLRRIKKMEMSVMR